MTRTGLIARVLIDSPLPQLDHLFDYAIPDELAHLAQPGVRVRVPLRSANRVADGYLIELIDPKQAAATVAPTEGATLDGIGGADTGYSGKLSPVDSIVSAVPVLTEPVWQLARRLADRAAGNASDIVRLAVPPRAVRVEKAWLAARDATPDAPATNPADPLAEPGFAEYPPETLGTIVADRLRVCVAAVPSLVRLPGPDDGGSTVGTWAITMAELAVSALRQGKSSILVVPDYRDQDQLQAALTTLAPADDVVRVDARQSNPDRYRGFLTLLEGRPRIILGNRSAVYAPAHDLGLIVLWDDGDPLYGEQLSPYVHARDAALIRREAADCALVFIGHSRSVETERLVEIGWLRAVHPTRDSHPRVIPTTFQSEPDAQARAARIPSAAWLAAKEAVRNGPVLVQVASPGYAPMLACRSCGKAARCTQCQGPLALANANATPACRWCGHLAAGWHCSHCEATTLRVVTVGTGRTAEELGRAFPGSRVIVADGEHTVQTIGPEPALVIATRGAEPIPRNGYSAILLLDGERMLARESLRVGEDCLRWWANAAALAAPGASVMLAGVGGALAHALNTWQPGPYAAAELADRRQLRFPPAVRVASVTGTTAEVDTAIESLAELPGLDVLGPVSHDPAGPAQKTGGPALVRAIVRFGYPLGDEVARTLKAAIVRNAAGRRKPKGAAFRPAPTLKVRFDDPELL
ncbi:MULTISPECIES: primosomal protein N' [unclassified Cryobacterium]|uniref:primosomal protein N' family DNA-binding protein n=1 Tax=unclassified Cryobacterium TaxID=2649013 RepID=UPI00106A5D36|nr:MULTISPECIES: primosomal protein N' [unclassified Cryobacterium]TFC57191.1 primosomal protein N' [Cryobacterium sp. TMB1-7]TFC90711.1 primosomal protein N' [Cryobacterium sp. TMT4-31]